KSKKPLQDSLKRPSCPSDLSRKPVTGPPGPALTVEVVDRTPAPHHHAQPVVARRGEGSHDRSPCRSGTIGSRPAACQAARYTRPRGDRGARASRIAHGNTSVGDGAADGCGAGERPRGRGLFRGRPARRAAGGGQGDARRVLPLEL